MVFTKVLLSQNTAYEKFQKYVQSSKGFVIQVEYFQNYFDEEVLSSGVLYVKNKMYIYDNEKQFLKFENGLITTINKSILIKTGNFIDTISVNKNIISFNEESSCTSFNYIRRTISISF